MVISDSGLATFNLRVTDFALPLAPTEDKIDETAMPLSVGTRVGPYERSARAAG